MNVSMEEFGRRFARAYDELYRTRDGLPGYREAAAGFAADSLPMLVKVRSGSAVYWDMAEGRYLICEGSAYRDDIEVVCKADNLREALSVCDNHAGFCLPMEEYPERLPIPAA